MKQTMVKESIEKSTLIKGLLLFSSHEVMIMPEKEGFWADYNIV